jgi:hypothetical protein
MLSSSLIAKNRCQSGSGSLFLFLFLLGLPLTGNTEVGMGLGAQLGTDDGVSIGVQQWDIGVGVRQFVVNVDRRFITREFPAMYFGLGAQVSEKPDEHVGLRMKLGLSARAGLVELFGEVAPTMTYGSNGDLFAEYNVGLRFWF